MKIPSRLMWFLGLILVIAAFSTLAWIESDTGVQPCPLCALQRLVLMGLGVIFALGCLTGGWVNRLLAWLATAGSLSGVLLAGRQVWLQWYPPPDTGAGCGASLQYLLHVMSPLQVLHQAIQGSAECGRVSWTFLHLSLAEWSLGCFVLFLAVSLYQATGRGQHRGHFRRY